MSCNMPPKKPTMAPAGQGPAVTATTIETTSNEVRLGAQELELRKHRTAEHERRTTTIPGNCGGFRPLCLLEDHRIPAPVLYDEHFIELGELDDGLILDQPSEPGSTASYAATFPMITPGWTRAAKAAGPMISPETFQIRVVFIGFELQ